MRDQKYYEKGNQKIVDKTASAKVKPKEKVLPQADKTVTMLPPKAKALERPLRSYGYWTGSGRPNRPNALILFSGRSRACDIQEFLDGYTGGMCVPSTHCRLSPPISWMMPCGLPSRRT